MYSLVKSLAKARAIGSRWEEVNIGNLPMNEISLKYVAVIFILHNTVTDETHAVDSRNLHSSNQYSKLTLNNWLIENANTSLPIMDYIPELSNENVVIYRDAFDAGYKVEPTPGFASHTANVLPEDKRWLRVSKNGIDTNQFHKNFMVSVNGYFHRIDRDNTDIFVIEGNRTSMISGRAHLGLHSYLRVGEIKYHDISLSNIHQVNPLAPIYKKALVEFKDNIENETVGLVIGGILYILDERVFRVVAPNQILINFENIDLINWFVEADMNIDLTSLPIDRIGTENHHITKESLLTEDCIRAILTLSQSFLVTINAKNMYRDFLVPESASYSNIYISPKEPIWPMRTNGGRIAEFIYHHEDGQYAIHAHHFASENHLHDTISKNNQSSIGDYSQPANPFKKTKVQFELIGVDL